jgi:hypothetical protein
VLEAEDISWTLKVFMNVQAPRGGYKGFETYLQSQRHAITKILAGEPTAASRPTMGDGQSPGSFGRPVKILVADHCSDSSVLRSAVSDRRQTVGSWVLRIATVSADGSVLTLPLSVAFRRAYMEFTGLVSPFSFWKAAKGRDALGRTFWDREAGFMVVRY